MQSSGGTAAAQYPDDEYYPYAEREERRELLVTDSTLFYRAVQSAADLYGEQTDFNLPQVAFKRRGLERRAGRISFAGMDLSYRYLPALRLLGAEEIRYAGLVPPPGESGGAGGVRLVGFSAGAAASWTRAITFAVKFSGTSPSASSVPDIACIAS